MTETAAAAESTAGTTMVGSTSSDWHQWCRLCAKEHSDNLNVYFRDGDQAWTSVLAVAIGKYFWVNIKMEDELSNVLCKECYSLVEDLVEFSDRVNRVQTLFTKLQQSGSDTTLNYDQYRIECGLSLNWKHIASRIEPESQLADTPHNTTADFVIENTAETYDEDAEIMAEIEAAEIVEKEESEKNYATYAVRDESQEEAYIEQAAPNVDEHLLLEQKTSGEEAHLDYPVEEFMEELSEEVLPDNLDVDRANIPYKCIYCNKAYKKPLPYKRHMVEVHDIVPADLPILQCKRCDAHFATENQLTAHYRTHMPTKDKAVNACAYCPKFFTTVGALKRHILCIHENVKPFVCDCCGKGMKTITALNEHKLVHTDECPFECTVCHRRFKNKARLKVHADTHTNNNYECNICGLKLNTRRTLNMHQLVHKDDKQHKCDVCGAAFKRSKTLKAHLILHTGIRPYKCNFCGKDFSNGSNCRMHKRKTHPKELAEEESRGVIRSTLLPMITELTEASKRVKKPAKTATSTMRVKVKEESISDKELEQEDDDELLYEMVEECS